MFTSIPSLDSVLQCLLPVFTQPVVSDARRGIPRLGDVSEQTNGVRRVPDDPSRYAGVSATAAPLRPLLQLLQPFWLDGARPRPSGRRGRGRPTQPARPVVSGRQRHAAAQTRQTRLRLGLVPRCRGLDVQAGGHRQRQSLGGGGIGDLHPRNHQDLLPPHPRQVAPGGQGPEKRSDLGQGNAPRYPGMVSRSKAGFSRRWGLFDEESAWRSRPASDLCGRDASRCGHLRSNAAEAIQEQTRTEGEKRGRVFPIRRRR